MEEDFPRGGALKTPLQTSENEDPDLFQSSEVTESQSKARKRKAAKAEKVVAKKAKTTGTFVASEGQAEFLSLRNVCPDMLILGYVKAVHDYELLVSLPGGLTGTVSISHISDSYRNLLQLLTENAQSESADTQDLGVHNLHELFKTGMLVLCKVLDFKQNKKGHRTIQLTINPKETNHSFQVTTLRDGMSLFGSIASVEDHGYVVDVGVDGVRAFLNNKDAERYIQLYNEGYPLDVGQYVMCQLILGDDRMAMMTGGARTVKITIDTNLVSKAELKDAENIPLSAILPGMRFNTTVDKTSEDGLCVKFLKYKGRIHKTHLPASPRTYGKGDKVEARVLFIHPTTKSVSLTLLQHIVDYKGVALTTQFQGLAVGDICADVPVQRADTTRGVYLRLPDNCTGFANMRHLSDKPVNDVAKMFCKGSTHRCRILDFDYMDNVAKVSLQKSILNQSFLKLKDITPGSEIECTVNAFHKQGVSVKVTSQVRGFIPNMHLADVPLKHPEKKFQEGDKLNCRVLEVDPEKFRLTLTNKKSLVASKLPIITEFDQLKTGMELEGFIVSITDRGVLVVFYNNMKGWVPKPELSTQPVPYPEKVFYVGQVVRCRVMQVLPEQQKLKLSFKIDGKTPFGNKSTEVPEDYEVGKIVECCVLKKAEKGLDVEVLPTKKPAYLPKSQLSDSVEMCDLLLNLYKEWDVLTDVMYLNRTSNTIVTRKLSMLQSVKDGQIVQELSQLKVGMMIPGTVKNLMNYGVFVEFPGGLIGLAPNKYASDTKLDTMSVVYKPGQSVEAKVIEVDQSKQRFLVSLRMVDCYHGDTDIGLSMLEHYLEERRMVMESLRQGKAIQKKLGNLQLGSIHHATVTKVTEFGILCKLENGVKGLATTDHMEDVGTLKHNDKVEVVILYVDAKVSSVEVTLNKDLIKAVKHRKENKYSEVHPGQIVKAEVHLVKDDFILVSLRGHASGLLAVVPAKRHYNDVLEKHQFAVGQVNPVVIKREVNGLRLAVLQIHEPKDDLGGLGGAGKNQIKAHKLKIGSFVRATVRSVHTNQMNLSVMSIPGRVHITEVLDQIKDGSNPFETYKESMEILVKIIGFRDKKLQSFLPVSHPDKKQSMPECTLKPSKLQMKTLKTGEEVARKKIKTGDKVIAFVQHFSNKCLWMNITPTVRGYVNILNLSHDKKILADPHAYFLPGHGFNATVTQVNKNGKLELSLIDKEEIIPGVITTGIVQSTNASEGLYVHLTNGYRGQVALTDLADAYRDKPVDGFHVGQIVTFAVVSVNQGNKRCVLSLRKSRLEGAKRVKRCPDIQKITDLSLGQTLKGFIIMCNESGVLVSLGHGIHGRAPFEHVSGYYIEHPDQVFTRGKVITVNIISIDHDKKKVELSFLEKDTGIPECIPHELQVASRQDAGVHVERKKTPVKKKSNRKALKRKTAAVTEERLAVKKKKAVASSSDTDSGVELSQETSSDINIEVLSSESLLATVPRLQVRGGFSWDNDFTLSTTSQPDDIDSDDDSNEETRKKSVKKTKEELRKEREEEERRLIELERKQLDGDVLPQTADDFDRLVLNSPDSSLIWLRYMAFHLETTEMEKARAVAERALKTISFREEQEKLNMWVGYLNLENMYGTPDSLSKVLGRAIQQNEPINVYQQMINIYIKSGKSEDAEQLYNTMVRRYSMNKNIWIGFGLFLFKNGRLEAGRKLLQRSLQSLENRDHVETIAKFGQMEFKHGEPERGKTMFENIVSNYPKRTDLWSVYIDMVTKLGDVGATRHLFERVIHLKLSAKKMKFFFKKYLDFEKAHGDEKTVSSVKQKALDYVESQGYIGE